MNGTLGQTQKELIGNAAPITHVAISVCVRAHVRACVRVLKCT